MSRHQINSLTSPTYEGRKGRDDARRKGTKPSLSNEYLDSPPHARADEKRSSRKNASPKQAGTCTESLQNRQEANVGERKSKSSLSKFEEYPKMKEKGRILLSLLLYFLFMEAATNEIYQQPPVVNSDATTEKPISDKDVFEKIKAYFWKQEGPDPLSLTPEQEKELNAMTTNVIMFKQKGILAGMSSTGHLAFSWNFMDLDGLFRVIEALIQRFKGKNDPQPKVRQTKLHVNHF